MTHDDSAAIVPVTHADVIERTRKLVLAYTPTSSRDADSQREILTFLDTTAEPFSRDAQPAHLTASAILAGPRGTVLHRHKITDTWLQPGGHVDDGEAPWDAVVREVLEETGFAGRHRDVGRLFDVDVHDTPRRHRHLDLRWLIDVDDHEPRPGPGESTAISWFTWDDAVRVGDPTLADVLPKALTF